MFQQVRKGVTIEIAAPSTSIGGDAGPFAVIVLLVKNKWE
jgi:hypothetical protein